MKGNKISNELLNEVIKFVSDFLCRWNCDSILSCISFKVCAQLFILIAFWFLLFCVFTFFICWFNSFSIFFFCLRKIGECLPAGLLDISECYYGFPIALSYPHFLDTDEKVASQIEGLTPNRSRHETYFYVQPVSWFRSVYFILENDSQIAVHKFLNACDFVRNVKITRKWLQIDRFFSMTTDWDNVFQVRFVLSMIHTFNKLSKWIEFSRATLFCYMQLSANRKLHIERMSLKENKFLFCFNLFIHADNVRFQRGKIQFFFSFAFIGKRK